MQANLQVLNVLDAWERQDFEAARSALRQVLLWDPDRLRLVQADRALQTTVSWLETIQAGVVRDEPLQEFITRQELVGRELRNQIGPAAWLRFTYWQPSNSSALVPIPRMCCFNIQKADPISIG